MLASSSLSTSAVAWRVTALGIRRDGVPDNVNVSGVTSSLCELRDRRLKSGISRPNRTDSVRRLQLASNRRPQRSASRRGTLRVEATVAPSRPPLSSEQDGEERKEVGFNDGVESSSSGTTESDGTFVWKDHWYPVSLVEDLDTDVPTPYQVLGRDIVVWKDREGSWRAFVDKCPHRLAPLSEGRIDESGWLQCSYHGWSFKPDGSCGVIPQASTQGPESKAQFSPKACAITLPTLVSDGLLFVWPDEKGWETAANTEPPRLPPAFYDPDYAVVNIQRDLYYGYDTLMENVSDPSHINFAHHKVTGRRDRAKPIPFKVEESGHWGFKGSNSDEPKITTAFYPPTYFANRIELPAPKLPFSKQETWTIWICSFNVPMGPGKTRSIVCSARNFFQFLVPGPEWWKFMPRWVEHWTSNKVYDGDMIVLQGQEKWFGRGQSFSEASKNYSKLTFTPTQADRFVLAFRNWLKKHGNGQPGWFPEVDQTQPLPSTVLSKRDMLDRFEQHTMKCSSCKNAFKRFQVAKKILWGAAVVFAAGAGVPSDLFVRVLLAATAVVSAGAGFVLTDAEKNFVFKDYVHAEID